MKIQKFRYEVLPSCSMGVWRKWFIYNAHRNRIQDQPQIMNLEINDGRNLRTADSEVGISSDHQLNPKFIF